jgi:predicted MFS family arabinose efflux permease
MAPLLARHHDFRLLWTATTISSIGSWLLIIAVPVQVYRLTGQAAATGLALAVEATPALLIGAWAGVVIDRSDRRRLLIGAHLAAAASVLVMIAHSGLSLIYIGLFAENVTVAFLVPALRALTPAVVSGEADLAAANSTIAVTQSTTRLVAPALGTLMLGHGSFAQIVLIDAASYLIAAVLLVRLAARPAPAVQAAPRQLRDGLGYLARTPLLRGLALTTWAYWTANAGLTALLIPFLERRLHQPPQALGLLITGLGVGYLLGSALAKPVILRYATRTLVIAAYAAVGLCFLVLFNAPNLIVALIAVTASGLPGAVALVATQHRLQADTPDAVRGRVLAAFFTTDAAAAMTGALAGPLLAGLAGLGFALTALSVAVLLTAAAAALVLPTSRSDLGSARDHLATWDIGASRARKATISAITLADHGSRGARWWSRIRPSRPVSCSRSSADSGASSSS